MAVENIYNHIAYKCECGCVHFNLLRSNSIECADCQKVFGRWSENVKTIAKIGCADCKEYGRLLDQAKRMRLEDKKGFSLDMREAIERCAAIADELFEAWEEGDASCVLPDAAKVSEAIRTEFNLPKAG